MNNSLKSVLDLSRVSFDFDCGSRFHKQVVIIRCGYWYHVHGQGRKPRPHSLSKYSSNLGPRMMCQTMTHLGLLRFQICQREENQVLGPNYKLEESRAMNEFLHHYTTPIQGIFGLQVYGHYLDVLSNKNGSYDMEVVKG